MSDSRQIKIMLLGDSGVGKSTWCRALHEHKFRHIAHVEKSYYVDDAKIQYGMYSFSVADTSGDKKHIGLINNYIATKFETAAFIIFYNLYNRESFNNVDEYVKRLGVRRAVNSRANLILIGTDFGNKGSESKVTEEEAEAKAKKFELQNYYGVDVRLVASEYHALVQPLNYVAQNAILSSGLPLPDFENCYKDIKDAIRYCKNEERLESLNNFKRLLDGFAQFKGELTVSQAHKVQNACDGVVVKAQEILASAFPERVKMAVLGAAAAVLLITAAVCGLALFNVIMLPILAATIVASLCCAVAGVGGITALAFCLFKVKENNIYSSIVSDTKHAVKDTKQECSRIVAEFNALQRRAN